MLLHHIKTAFRTFLKTKFYSSLNILGLAIGLASFLVISLYVYDEWSYDKFNTKAPRIYRVNNKIKIGSISVDVAQTPPLLGPETVKQIPGVEQYTRFRRGGTLLIKKGNINLREDRVVYADSTLLEVFSLNMISGDPGEVLKAPRSMVITESMAKKYFNRTDVAGESLIINDTTDYKIAGVIKDIPGNSHFSFDFFLAFSESKRSREPEWLSQNFNTYLLLQKGTDPRNIEKHLDAMLNRFIVSNLQSDMGISLNEFTRQGNYIKNTLTPLLDIHLLSARPGEIGVNGNIQYVRIFSLIAVFILIIAYVNFINLFTARSSKRAKEIGLRRLLGSNRKGLVNQVLTESLLTSYMSLVIAILFALLLLPYFNQLSGKNISLRLVFQPEVLGLFLLATTFTGLIAGWYPALLLSAFKPIEIFKGKIARGFKSGWLRNALVVFQFAISIVLIIGTIVIYRQLKFINSKDLGFNRQQVLVIQNTSALKTQAGKFKNDLLQLQGISMLTMTGYLPVNGYRNDKTFHPSPVIDPKSAIGIQTWSVDENYIPTLHIQVLQGRNFSPEFLTDSTGLILNEAAALLLGSSDLVNKKLYSSANPGKVDEYHIIGVMKNFYFNSLREVITPLCLTLSKETSSMAIRVTTANISTLISQIKHRWQEIAPGQPFNYSFMDKDFDHLYDTEQRAGQIFITFSVLSIFIACMGLFGLVAYAAEQRVKEIGIRKVLGASVTNIVSLLSIDLLKLVVIAAFVSIPVADWLAVKWLEGFADRIDVRWDIFAIAGFAALATALLTISFQAIKSAVVNPVKNLRTE